MNTRRTSARRVVENDVNGEILLQVDHFSQGALGDKFPIEGQGNDVPVVPQKRPMVRFESLQLL